jgi:hypothetical protein
MSSNAVLHQDSDRGSAFVAGVAVVGRRLVAAMAAALIAFAFAFALPGGAAAHGCGSADHWSGGPHYYEGRVTIGNSRFTRWYEVNLGSGGFNYTWCGCVNPNKPCIK